MKPTDLDDTSPPEPDRVLLSRIHARSRSFHRQRTARRVAALVVGIAVLAVAGGIALAHTGNGTTREITPGPTPGPTSTAVPTTAPAPGDSIIGMWVPQAIAEAPIGYSPPAEVGARHLQFRAGDQWSGYDGCNNYEGSYRLGSGGAFSLHITSQTLVGCPAGLPTLSRLAAATRVELGGGRLTFFAADGSMLGRYDRPGSAAAMGTPGHPYGLTVAPDGTLYIVDVGRDQVLRRIANGSFAVVAGDGRQGSSGDGGEAVSAELRLTPFSGIVASNDGTLYIGDTGNSRVRALLPNGTIESVAGNGQGGMLLGSGPARSTAIGNVSGLTIGPDGDLYIAASSIVRLTPDGTLHWVAGTHGPLPACGSVSCNPASESDLSEPDSLAFDGAHNLLVSDANFFGLYEIAASGAITYLEQFRGDGAPGALAPAPDGSVVEAWRGGLTRRTAAGAVTQFAVNLSAQLGGRGKLRNSFIGGDGVAVDAAGDVYVDTNSGNTFTSVSALLEVTTDGRIVTLWKS